MESIGNRGQSLVAQFLAYRKFGPSSSPADRRKAERVDELITKLAAELSWFYEDDVSSDAAEDAANHDDGGSSSAIASGI